MIKRIRIQNYKSLGDVTVDLDPVTVLIGRSGTGKTNFVDAIRFMRDYLRTGDDAAQSRGGWQLLKPATGHATSTTFESWFDVPGIEGTFEYLLGFKWEAASSTSAAFIEERLDLRNGRVLFHQQQSRWIAEPAVIPAPAPGVPAVGRISGVSEINVAALVLTVGIACHSFPENVLLTASNPSAQAEGLSDTGDSYLQVVTGLAGNIQSLRNWQEIVAAMRGLNRSVKTLTLEMPRRNRITVGHDIGNGVLTLPLPQESEGFRRFLAHLLAMFQVPPKELLVFEEPEKGIHPAALEGLVNQFRSCASSGRGQVMLTSHSPNLLDYFQPDELRVVDLNKGWTQIGPLAPEQIDAVRENLLRPGELLTVDQARLPGTLASPPEAVAP